MRKRETEEREEKLKLLKIIKKHYLNEMVKKKNRSDVICYKIEF